MDPQLVFVSGGPPNIAALLSGDLDFTVFAGPASIAANLEGADTILLMIFINTMEHRFITRPDIKKPADLKGKGSAWHWLGAADDYGARVAFRK